VLSWQHESETVQTPGTTLCNAIARLSLQRSGFNPSQFMSDLRWSKRQRDPVYCQYCGHYQLHALQTSLAPDQREFQLIRPDMTAVYCTANSTCFGLTGHYQVDQQHTYTVIRKLRSELVTVYNVMLTVCSLKGQLSEWKLHTVIATYWL
jgi:hypothetical protein